MEEKKTKKTTATKKTTSKKAPAKKAAPKKEVVKEVKPVVEEKIEVKEEIKEIKKEEPKKEVTKKVSNYDLFIYISAAIVLVIAILVCARVFAKKTLEPKLSNSLSKMGETFYTEFYYEQVSNGKSSEEIANSLGNFKDIGIKIDLENLAKYSDDFKKEVANFKNVKGEACNQKTTRAVIYPKAPYGKKDYKVEVELDCNFGTRK